MKSDLRLRRRSISKTLETVEKGEKGEKGDRRGGEGLPIIRRNSGPTHVARGGSGANAPPLAAHPVIRLLDLRWAP